MNLKRQIRSLWFRYKAKTLMIERVLIDLDMKCLPDDIESGSTVNESKNIEVPWKDFELSCDNMSDARYIPLLKRPRDDSLEDKLKKHSEKKRANIKS